MATKKKAAKKAAAKKTTKKVYRRKAAAKPLPQEEQQQTQAEPTQGSTFDDQADANSVGRAMFGDVGTDNAEDAGITLEQVQVIDLRDLKLSQRLLVQCMLREEGYILADGQELLSTEELFALVNKCDALVLQHRNKLVSPALWEQPEVQQSRAISTVQVGYTAYMLFDAPRPSAPDTIAQDGAVYVRVL
jgi:hypothetical protein